MTGLRLLALLVAVVVLASACSGNGTRKASPARPTTTPEATSTAGAIATPVPSTAAPAVRSEFVPSPGARNLTVLLSEAQQGQLRLLHRAVQPLPAPSFRPWNGGGDVVLYDIEARRETNLGPGSFPGFTPDARYLYWISGTPVVGGDSELTVFEIQTSSTRPLGEARGVRADREAGYLQVQVPGGRFERVSLLDGSRTPRTPDLGLADLTPMAEYAGWRLEGLAADGWAYGFGRYRLSDLSGSLPPLEFEVWQVALLPDGALIVATSPADIRPQAGDIRGRTAASSIFEVDPVSGTAILVASARATEYLFPFATSERFVVWTRTSAT